MSKVQIKFYIEENDSNWEEKFPAIIGRGNSIGFIAERGIDEIRRGAITAVSVLNYAELETLLGAFPIVGFDVFTRFDIADRLKGFLGEKVGWNTSDVDTFISKLEGFSEAEKIGLISWINGFYVHDCRDVKNYIDRALDNLKMQPDSDATEIAFHKFFIQHPRYKRYEKYAEFLRLYDFLSRKSSIEKMLDAVEAGQAALDGVIGEIENDFEPSEEFPIYKLAADGQTFNQAIGTLVMYILESVGYEAKRDNQRQARTKPLKNSKKGYLEEAAIFDIKND